MNFLADNATVNVLKTPTAIMASVLLTPASIIAVLQSVQFAYSLCSWRMVLVWKSALSSSTKPS